MDSEGIRIKDTNMETPTLCPICNRELNPRSPIGKIENGIFDEFDPEHQRPPGYVEYDCPRCTRYNVTEPLVRRGFLLRDHWARLSDATRAHWESTGEPLLIDEEILRRYTCRTLR